ncbi:MAG: NosD domain-containing protein [Acidilobus sp.]
MSDSELPVTGRSGLGINVTGSDVSVVYVNVSSFTCGVYVKGPNVTVYGSNIQAASYTLYLYDSHNDLIYNNVFDGPVKVVNSTATWYVTPRPGTNVLGGKVIAGNAWLLPNGSGFSQVTPSSPSDPYICDEPYEVAPGQYDMYPLKYPQPSNASTATQTTTYSATTTTSSTTTVSKTTSTTVTTTTPQA